MVQPPLDLRHLDDLVLVAALHADVAERVLAVPGRPAERLDEEEGQVPPLVAPAGPEQPLQRRIPLQAVVEAVDHPLDHVGRQLDHGANGRSVTAGGARPTSS